MRPHFNSETRHKAGAVLRRSFIPLAALLLAAFLWVLVDLANQFNQDKTDDEITAIKLETVRGDLDDQRAAAKLLEKQVKDLGGDPVIVTEGPRSDTLVDAPSLFFAALVRYCEDRSSCSGARGPVGEKGDVSKVPGEPGQDSTVPGPSGQDSTVPGPAGQDSTTPGPKGEDSTVPGPTGAEGRGIQDAQCGDSGRWTITYTDGTSADGGACRSGPITPIPPAK